MWFKVDDKFHSHPKALEASLAAIGLWTLAGSWSGDHLQDGFVSDQAVRQVSRGAVELADELVAAGLWKRAKGGYRFHQWEQRNPTRSDTDRIADRKASGGALGNHLRWHAKTGKQNPDCQFCQEEPASDIRSDTDRTTDPKSDRSPNPEPEPDPRESSSNSLKPDPLERFDEFWAEFPRRDGRKEAEGAYAKALKRGVKPDTMIEGARLYAARVLAERRERSKIKMAQGWINNDRWEDEQNDVTPANDPYARRSLWDN